MTAVCWYDIALISRTSPLLEKVALKSAGLPTDRCNPRRDEYPWIDKDMAPRPDEYKCAPRSTPLKRGEVCSPHRVSAQRRPPAVPAPSPPPRTARLAQVCTTFVLAPRGNETHDGGNVDAMSRRDGDGVVRGTAATFCCR